MNEQKTILVVEDVRLQAAQPHVHRRQLLGVVGDGDAPPQAEKMRFVLV